MSLNSKLRLINGKFFKEGVEVPIEIGNPEQIQLIKKLQSKKQLLDTEGYLVNHNIEKIFQVYISFNCLCGEFIYTSIDQVDKEENIYTLSGNEKIQCQTCKEKYKVISDEKKHEFLIIFDKTKQSSKKKSHE